MKIFLKSKPTKNLLFLIILVVLLLGIFITKHLFFTANVQQSFPFSVKKELNLSELDINATTSPFVLNKCNSNNNSKIIVSVVGRVHKPGVFTVSENTRVYQVIKLAGGVLNKNDLLSINLAQKLVDGQQLVVTDLPVKDDAIINPSITDSDGKNQKTSLVHLNSATATQLESLPGIGKVIANNILVWRTTHGNFTRIEQLLEINGIGVDKYKKIKNLITL